MPIVVRSTAVLLFFLSLPAQAWPTWEPAVHRGIDLSLNEDFSAAHAVFDSLMRVLPERPEPYFCKAVVYWRQGMNVGDGFKYDPLILQLIDTTIAKAEDQIRYRGESAEMLLWLGNAYGLRTGLRMIRREVVKGVVDGYQGREYLFESLELDPDGVDANFGLGISDYILSQQPRILRIVQRLFSLPSGDREGGLRKLDRVIREGRFNRTDALSTRAYVDLYYERDRREALRRFADLLIRYPNSLDYRIRYLDSLITIAMENGEDLFEAMVDSVRSIRRIAKQRNWRLFRWRELKLTFIEGMAHYALGNTAMARSKLEQIVSRRKDEDNWLVGPAALTLGKVADLEGDREAARAHYRLAERREDVWGSQKEAVRHTIRPFDGSEPSSRPKDDVQRYPERP